VSGHVDGVGRVAERRPVGEAVMLAFTLPPELTRFVAEKGSIAVNGVSMTVNAVGGAGGVGEDGGGRFEVMVIPITQRETNLGALTVGDRVNLEVDLIARYVARLMVPADA
jgi:riboflavin synthase